VIRREMDVVAAFFEKVLGRLEEEEIDLLLAVVGKMADAMKQELEALGRKEK